MAISDELRLGIELSGILSSVGLSAGVILFKLGAIRQQIGDHGEAIDKMANVLVTQATQNEQIQSLRDSVATTTRRTDETFNRVFGLIEKLQERGK